MKINILKFVNMQSFIQKQKNFKLRTKIFVSTSNFKLAPSNLWNYKVSCKTKKISSGLKMHFFGLWAGISKIYCHICNQHTSICLIWKFPAKLEFYLELKMLHLGVLGSNCYICNFGVEMLKFGAKNDISLNSGPIILSYLKSTTSNLSISKTL